MERTQKFFYIGLVLTIFFLLSACGTGQTESLNFIPTSPESNPTPIQSTPTLSPLEERQTAIPPTPTKTLIPSWTPPPSLTPEPTLKPYSIPETTLVYESTPIPTPGEVISSQNVLNLAPVAQWGNGEIIDLAFSPKGDVFVVSSEYGYNIYSLDDKNLPPVWVPFENPIFFHSLYFSENGEYLLFEGYNGNFVKQLYFGETVQEDIEQNWIKSRALKDSWGVIEFTSADGQIELTSYVTHDDDFWDLEFSNRDVHNIETGELLYTLEDETIQVTYEERTLPEGCDFDSFSPCGNAFSPAASHPYRGGFSPSGDTFAILYAPPNLYSNLRFSSLKIYRASDGKLLNTLGDYDNSIVSFAHSVDGKFLLLGFSDGSIQLRDERGREILFHAWDFNSIDYGIEYTIDGKYLVIQRYSNVEVRSKLNGKIVLRVPGRTFDISPVANHLAVGGDDGRISLYDLDLNHRLYSHQAHNETILAITFSPDGKYLTTSSFDCSVRSWLAKTGGFQFSYAENRTNPDEGIIDSTAKSRIFIYTLDYVPGSNQLIGFGSWGRVAGWDTQTGLTQFLIEPEALEFYQGMVTVKQHFPEHFSVDQENRLFFINQGVYSLDSGEFVEEYKRPEGLSSGCAAFGPLSMDGKIRVTIGIGFNDGKLCILDAKDNHLIKSIAVVTSDDPDQYYDYINWIYLSPNGDQLVVSLPGGVLKILQIVP